MKSWMQAGRNDPCPCGSGKKYKYCCLRTDRRAHLERLHRHIETAMGQLRAASIKVEEKLAAEQEAIAASEKEVERIISAKARGGES